MRSRLLSCFAVVAAVATVQLAAVGVTQAPAPRALIRSGGASRVAAIVHGDVLDAVLQASNGTPDGARPSRDPRPFALAVAVAAIAFALVWYGARVISARRFAASARYAVCERAPPCLGR